MSLKSEMKYVFSGVTSRVVVDDGIDGGLLEVGGPLGLLGHLAVVGVLVLADVPVSSVCNGVDVLDLTAATRYCRTFPTSARLTAFTLSFPCFYHFPCSSVTYTLSGYKALPLFSALSCTTTYG